MYKGEALPPYTVKTHQFYEYQDFDTKYQYQYQDIKSPLLEHQTKHLLFRSTYQTKTTKDYQIDHGLEQITSTNHHSNQPNTHLENQSQQTGWLQHLLPQDPRRHPLRRPARPQGLRIPIRPRQHELDRTGPSIDQRSSR